jgi:peptidoglycan/LPS O-acetylase OafA/YrhL
MTGRTTSDSGALRKMGSAKMGYEPSLDGLRALSVIGVLLYHGGFSWMRGGFLGVEVFFVVSGYLITSLLIGEQEKTGRIDFKNFWIRRARRPIRPPARRAVGRAVRRQLGPDPGWRSVLR